jgi:hypothetical protein
MIVRLRSLIQQAFRAKVSIRSRSSQLVVAELSTNSIRVICLLAHAIAEATAMGFHSRDVWGSM